MNAAMNTAYPFHIRLDSFTNTRFGSGSSDGSLAWLKNHGLRCSGSVSPAHHRDPAADMASATDSTATRPDRELRSRRR